jgi:NTE family protein
MKNLILSGGSYNAIMYIGCIKCLEKEGLMKSITTIVGTSAGSIIGFLLALNFTSEEMTMLMNTQMASMINDEGINACALFEMFNTFGIDDGSRLVNIFRAALAMKSKDHDASAAPLDITFIELGKRYGRNLVICGANLSKRRSEYFSIDTHPDMSVITALRISCSIPIMFTPVHYDGSIYVDGGIYNNLPFDYFDMNNPIHEKHTIGINVNEKQNDISTFTGYMMEIFNSIIEKASQIEKIKVLTYICQLESNISLSTNVMQLYIEPEQQQILIDKGYICMNAFLIARSQSNVLPTHL